MYPFHALELAKIQTTDAKELLQKTEDTLKSGSQATAAAAAQKYGEAGHPARGLVDVLL